MSRLPALLIALATLTAPALAAPGATRLAEVDLRDAKDWDLVRLPPCNGPRNTPVTSLGVRVTKFPAEINRLVVRFYNGEKQELQLRERFAPGGASRWIDLSGTARCIRTIRIVGDASSVGWRPGRQAQVAFWGKGPGGAPVATASAAPTGGPDFGRLGAVRLTDAKDRDALTLPACAGSRNEPINRIKLRVNDFPAQIDRLVVRFHNGGTQELSVRKRFGAGSESAWLDLRGPARCVQSIGIVGDANSVGWRPGKQAEVVFWGKAL